MDLTFEKILENYWSQILLLLTAIGFVIKMIFNFILKKKEINHEIIYKHRINALNRFFNIYSEVKSMWEKLPIFKIYKGEFSNDEIDKQIQPSLNKLDASVLELQMYFNEKLYDKFKLIESNMRKINGRFLKIAFENNRNLTEKTNDYTFFVEDIIKVNTEILNEINKELLKKLK